MPKYRERGSISSMVFQVSANHYAATFRCWKVSYGTKAHMTRISLFDAAENDVAGCSSPFAKQKMMWQEGG